MSNNPTNSQPTGAVVPVVQPPTVTNVSVVQAIQTAVSGIPGIVSLDKAGRAKTPKAPLGFEPLGPLAVKAVTDYPEAKPGLVDPATITADLQRVAELLPVRAELTRDLRKVDDTILVARGEAWQAMLVIYDGIRSQSRLKPELENLVTEMAAFLAKRAKGGKGKGKRSKGSRGKTVHTVAPAAPSATSPAPETAPASEPASAKPGATGPAVTTVTTTTSSEPTQK
ncbi:MAG TPA: hypothetical protein VKT21_03010 [Thermoplasmata archaeon]|nr:hypothetical protein [Thermoplasmata archaeon]